MNTLHRKNEVPVQPPAPYLTSTAELEKLNQHNQLGSQASILQEAGRAYTLIFTPMFNALNFTELVNMFFYN